MRTLGFITSKNKLKKLKAKFDKNYKGEINLEEF
jgi:Ca2+-binding EF-hand superfamily protein